METFLRELSGDPEVTSHKVREIVLAMGPRAVDLLVPSLQDPDDRQRCLAADLLGRIGDRRAVEPLLAALEVRGLALDQELQRFPQPRDGWPDWGSYLCLWNTGRGSPIDRIIKQDLLALRQAARVRVRCSCAEALGRLGDSRAILPLRCLLRRAEESVRETVQTALASLEKPGAGSDVKTSGDFA